MSFKQLVGKEISKVDVTLGCAMLHCGDGSVFQIFADTPNKFECRDVTPEAPEYEQIMDQIYNQLIVFKDKLNTIGFDWGFHQAIQNIAKRLNKVEKLKADKWYARVAEIERDTRKLKWTKNKAKMYKNEPAYKHALVQLKHCVRMLKNTAKWSEEPGMYAMALEDFADHYALACSLAENNFHLINKYTNLDTSSREEIPMSVWNFVNRW